MATILRRFCSRRPQNICQTAKHLLLLSSVSTPIRFYLSMFFQLVPRPVCPQSPYCMMACQRCVSAIPPSPILLIYIPRKNIDYFVMPLLLEAILLSLITHSHCIFLEHILAFIFFSFLVLQSLCHSLSFMFEMSRIGAACLEAFCTLSHRTLASPDPDFSEDSSSG